MTNKEWMSDHSVREIHIHMALQQSMLQQRYNHYIKENTPDVERHFNARAKRYTAILLKNV
ncbi:hypothetical protein [Alkalihalobacillus deserti]|uniref:hypothetical protein n=1 Tax=Alkalihalobacillus deserti TaxID=2879466 RepID=UPI001D15720B|nr:hypothetical protein [Alkalihalobacillus deserti]